MNTSPPQFTRTLGEIGINDVAIAGGKSASLGEMIRELGPKGVPVPSGFIVTADAYRYFLKEAKLEDTIRHVLAGFDARDVRELARRGKKIRAVFESAVLPTPLTAEIAQGYAALEREYGARIDVAVRSSATAEDLPGASFAGEHETFLGVRGIDDVVTAVKSAMASLFTDRAISYRIDKGFDHTKIALSVAIQRMVRSDKGASGVMFTVDTESGFKNVVIINASWGLGEMVVQGHVTPDEYMVAKHAISSAPNPIIARTLGSKTQKMIYRIGTGGIRPVKVVATSKKERATFVLTNTEIHTLATWGIAIEDHYSKKHGAWTPMDIEWAKDGVTGELFIVQARPETVHAGRDFTVFEEYARTENGPILTKGVSVGSKVASGHARVIMKSKNIHQFKKGEILVTGMTDPDWEPIMKIASAIVTDKGGRTSHAAIVSRELGIPAVVGTGNATHAIANGRMVTVDTVGSEGTVFAGKLAYTVVHHDLKTIPHPVTKIMMNLATPDTAFEKSFLPHAGSGLVREEFVIASVIGMHPLALLEYPTLPARLKREIETRTRGWENPIDFYIDNLAYGIAKIATAMWPHPAIVRFSDFKTNEYRTLLGGERYEPEEENPMMGWRGASRYYDPKFREAFKLECRAITKVRNDMGLTNVIPMVPFCRTPREGMQTLEIMAGAGLYSHAVPSKQNGDTHPPIPVYVMCEIPANIIRADEFLDLFDGMSIGSNDLTQLVLGLDRDSGIVSHVANENDPAVTTMIAQIIAKCRARKKYIGICGQAPSDYPDFARLLVREGIESMSVTPDTVVRTIMAVAEQEKALSTKPKTV